MLYYLVAAGLVAHTFFWGAGLAWIVTPRAWRPLAWMLAPGCGIALQSAVVWLGAHTPLAGTQQYAWFSELLPLALLVVAWRRRSPAHRGWGVARTVVPLVVVAGIAGWVFLAPMAARGGWTLTTSSLGSCDHADYAAGARVFQEFSRNDRVGFLGLPEVTRVRSAEYFFDFWLRINHFTPSALVAHHAVIFRLAPYQLISVSAATLVLLNLPILLLLARVMLRIRGVALVLLALVYGLSPLNAYAVHHGALGQLYAAQGIALLTLAVYGASREQDWRRSLRRFGPLMGVALWVLAGSYNFILLVALAPAGLWVAGWMILRRTVRPALSTALPLAAALAACVLCFWGRFDGLIERFSLFEEYNFGWAVPVASPEGWVGVLRTVGLEPWSVPVRIGSSVVVVALWVFGVAKCWRSGARGPALAGLALVVPVIAGWGLLAWESRVRANASYDAYKILSVFYPGLLAGLLGWLGMLPKARAGQARAVGFVVIGGLIAANAVMAGQFFERMKQPPFRVDQRLVQVGQLEHDGRISSLNLMIDDFWARLWANAFLLRKPQFFAVHTYEGRLPTALRGEWSLSDQLLRTLPVADEAMVTVNDRFFAVRAGAEGRLRASFAEGWHAFEHDGRWRWRWSQGNGVLALENRESVPVKARLTLRGRVLAPQDLTVTLNGASVGRVAATVELQTLPAVEFTLPPGRSALALNTAASQPELASGDARRLGVALYDFELRAVALEK